jgi:GNAT superfamily N-acetyltransferase
MSPASPTLLPRAFHDDDIAEVVDMINADHVPGQSVCTPAMLEEAMAGRSPVDSGWWAELDQVAVRGVVSYARRRDADTAVILWLHGREEPATVDALLDRATRRLTGSTTVDAFEFASALTVGLEGLPVKHRQTTRKAFRAQGFTESALWRYMHRDLPATELPVAATAQVVPSLDNPGWLIQQRQPDGTRARRGKGIDRCAGLGVLWWIAIEPQHRGHGLGRPLLGSALHVLHREGAREVILFVDDDAPLDDLERGRGAANARYDRAGFVKVDRLCSYRRSL